MTSNLNSCNASQCTHSSPTLWINDECPAGSLANAPAREVVNEAFELKVDTREPGSSLGTGGMSTKIAAARTAHCAGAPRVRCWWALWWFVVG
eukprot:Skav230919  [mRNA]  locus=scaffold2578:85725:86003:- [translate_table: standard]